MAFGNNKKPFDLKRIQRKYNISQASIDGLTIKKQELKNIYEDYYNNLSNLEVKKNEILTYLNERLSENVHSIRGRVKDPDHLIEKIIRNINGKPEKYASLSIDNYNKIITDLIGIRVIILDKRQWRAVHDILLNIFRNMPGRYITNPKDTERFFDQYKDEFQKKDIGLNSGYHAEKPVVYITSDDDRQIYVDDNLRIDTSKACYRSIHYIIRYKEVYFEIQVRTLFEEGWLEFDHLIKYPYDRTNRRKQQYADILNSLAVAADNLISFYEENDFKTSECRKKLVEEIKEKPDDDNNGDIGIKDRIKKY